MARFYLACVIATIVVLSFTNTNAQDNGDYNDGYGEYADYQDYGNDEYAQEDNLYYDYADREEQKKYVTFHCNYKRKRP